MGLRPLHGHREARQRLATAISRGQLPQVLLLTGPQGIGKQRLALWLAQRLLCERPDGTEPCGTCRTCLRVLDLGHADLHWFVPLPRPKAADSDKQVEEVAELLAEAIGERRAGRWTVPDGMLGHGIAAMWLLQRRAQLRPVEGRQAVFILGDAERLVTQESSHEAANALLKLLEEPPAHAVIVLTTSDPRRLLPTIRSRTVPLRLAPLAPAEVTAALADFGETAGTGRPGAHGGSVGRALQGEVERPELRAAAALLDALQRGGLPLFEQVLRQSPWSARGEFTALLDALAETLLRGAEDAVEGRGRGWLAQREPAALAAALERVATTREAAQGNVNPQLLLAVLGQELQEALCA